MNSDMFADLEPTRGAAVPVPPADQLRAVVRDLATAERDGRTVRVLSAERVFAAAPEEVWNALTSAERIPRWFVPVSGELEVGGRFQLEGNAGGTVLACEPPHGLSITWEFGGATSWVDVALEAADAGTRLLLRHTAPLDEAMWEQFGPGAVGIGWEMGLMGLAEHLAAPDAAPGAVQEWVAGTEGRAYLLELMTRCSEAWAEVSIRFGTDPASARAAAQRCTAAYTADPAAPGEEPA
jgi:uncharacterized protein YndB with AHSA1/START domain